MTSKEVKRWLETYRSLGREIEYIRNEIEEWESAAEWATSRITGMPKGGGNAGFVSAIEAIDKLLSKLSEKITEKIALREEIEEAVGSVEDKRYREVLTLRYIHGMRFVKIAAAMNYEERNVYELCNDALTVLAKRKEESLQ